MKWTLLVGVVLLSAGCVSQVVEYQQVNVGPIVAPMAGPVVEPVILDVEYPYEPLDVTTTTIDFY